MYQIKFILDENRHHSRDGRSSEFDGVLRRVFENIFCEKIDRFRGVFG